MKYAAAFILLLLPTAGRTQMQTPEFRLDLILTDTAIDGNNRDTVIFAPRGFGYDPQATDAYDAAFGEDVFYPEPSIGFDLNYLAFQYPNSAWTEVDICHKPVAD